MKFPTWRTCGKYWPLYLCLVIVGGGWGMILHNDAHRSRICAPGEFVGLFSSDNNSYLVCREGQDFKIKPDP